MLPMYILVTQFSLTTWDMLPFVLVSMNTTSPYIMVIPAMFIAQLLQDMTKRFSLTVQEIILRAVVIVLIRTVSIKPVAQFVQDLWVMQSIIPLGYLALIISAQFAAIRRQIHLVSVQLTIRKKLYII